MRRRPSPGFTRPMCLGRPVCLVTAGGGVADVSWSSRVVADRLGRCGRRDLVSPCVWRPLAEVWPMCLGRPVCLVTDSEVCRPMCLGPPVGLVTGGAHDTAMAHLGLGTPRTWHTSDLAHLGAHPPPPTPGSGGVCTCTLARCAVPPPQLEAEAGCARAPWPGVLWVTRPPHKLGACAHPTLGGCQPRPGRTGCSSSSRLLFQLHATYWGFRVFQKNSRM